MPMLNTLGKKPPHDLDCNEVFGTSLQYSPSNSACDIGYNNTKLVHEKLMSVMPSFYIDGEISKVNIVIRITFIIFANLLEVKIIDIKSLTSC